MEILGIGTDIIECPRIGKMIEKHGELFLRRFTPRGDSLLSGAETRDRALRRAVAAKEAILKAMGTGRSRGIAWTHVEVRNGQDGNPASWSVARRRQIARERGHRRHPGLDLALPHLSTAYAMAVGRPDGTLQPTGPSP